MAPLLLARIQWKSLARLQRIIGEMIIMMTKETNSGDTIRWKDHIEFGDAVPVGQLRIALLPSANFSCEMLEGWVAWVNPSIHQGLDL